LNYYARDEECKLKTELHVMMVSVEAPRSRHAGFLNFKNRQVFLEHSL